MAGLHNATVSRSRAGLWSNPARARSYTMNVNSGRPRVGQTSEGSQPEEPWEVKLYVVVSKVPSGSKGWQKVVRPLPPIART